MSWIMASPAKLSHVVLYSQQIPVMRDWYLRVLDGRVVHEAPGVTFLTYDDEHHRVAIADPTAMREVGAEALVGGGSGPVAGSWKEIAAWPPHGLVCHGRTAGKDRGCLARTELRGGGGARSPRC